MSATPDRAIIDSYFDPEGYEAELRSLPGAYHAPRGALLVAESDGRMAGCVAMKPLADGACEMKRLFVNHFAHGLGLGRALAVAVIQRAKAMGYSRMLLDAGPLQVEAQTLYHRLGFRDVEPYYELPPQLRDWLVFMELDLRA